MRMSSVRAFVWAIRGASGAVLVAALTSCGGGGGGGSGSGSLDVVGVTAENTGVLPQNGLFLNQRLIFTFTTEVDPATVTPEVFRIRQGPNFTIQAQGDFRVSGRQVTFVPALPTKVDLSDAGLVAGQQYRIRIQGFPNAVALNSTRGRPLTSTYETTFTTRSSAPLLRDIVPGRPHVIGILVDLNGDGVLDGNGLCEPQRQPEQFLDRNAAEFRTCTSPDLTDLSAVPFVANVRVGAVSTPLLVGVVFSEPVLPASVTQDQEDVNGDGSPDGNGQPDNFILSDLTNRVDSDGDGIPDVARSIPVKLQFEQDFIADFGTNGRYFVVAKLNAPFTVEGNAEINLQAVSGITDFAGNQLDPFSVTFMTGATPPTDDHFLEPFDTLDHFDPKSDAEWNTNRSGFLQAGRGLGGGGSDGLFTGRETAFCSQDPNATTWTCTLDTNRNSGVYNFTLFTIPAGTKVVGVGPNPLRINSIGDVSISGRLDVSGLMGLAGIGNNNAIRQGGAPGPGGFRGGRARAPADPNQCNAATPCYAENGQGTGGGFGGKRSNNSSGNSGGGGGGSYRTVGSNATGGGNTQGNPNGTAGAVYGSDDLSNLVGGSGGGAGGNKPPSGSATSTQDSSGGSGGGGGGAVQISTAGNVTIASIGAVLSNGGAGGIGFFAPSGTAPASAGGAGGSGGAIKILARSIDPIGVGSLSASGGVGGIGNSNEGDGGTGGFGRIRLEDLDGSVSVAADPNVVASIGTLPANAFSHSTANSTFYDTNVTSARYAFDATDPGTGNLLVLPDGTLQPGVTDVTLAAPVDPRVTVNITFVGARAFANNPNEVDLATETAPTPNIQALNGYQFIRFVVSFESTSPLTDVPRPILNDLRMRFQFP
jgi:hypothetical protein